MSFDRTRPPRLEGVEHRFVDLPAVRLHLAEAGPHDADAVLMLHGAFQTWWEWREVIPALAARYRVLAIDLRGFGWSDAPHDGYRSPDFVQDLIDLLDALDLEQVRLLSHDFGSIIAHDFATTHPVRVVSSIGMSVPPFTIRVHPGWLRVMWRAWYQAPVTAPLLGPRLLGRGRQRLPRHLLRAAAVDPSRWSEADVEAFVAPLRDPAHARATAETYRRLILPRGLGLLRSRSHDLVAVPTHLMVGAEDPVVAPMVRLGNVSGRDPHLTVELVDGANHFIVDDRPEIVIERALQFFATH